jgi:hypothetical protein
MNYTEQIQELQKSYKTVEPVETVETEMDEMEEELPQRSIHSYPKLHLLPPNKSVMVDMFPYCEDILMRIGTRGDILDVLFMALEKNFSYLSSLDKDLFIKKFTCNINENRIKKILDNVYDFVYKYKKNPKELSISKDSALVIRDLIIPNLELYKLVISVIPKEIFLDELKVENLIKSLLKSSITKIRLFMKHYKKLYDECCNLRNGELTKELICEYFNASIIFVEVDTRQVYDVCKYGNNYVIVLYYPLEDSYELVGKLLRNNKLIKTFHKDELIVKKFLSCDESIENICYDQI